MLPAMSGITRRRLLSALAALPALGALWPGRAHAIGERSLVSMGQLKHGNGWNDRPEALRRLLWEVKRRTSVNAATAAVPLTLLDDEIFYQPLLVLTGSGALPPLDEKARARLERHLRFGGMLWVDAPSPNDGFAKDARAWLEDVLPPTKLEPLPKEHVLFKSYFLVDRAYGRNEEETGVLALSTGDRTVALLTQCDVLGALERDRFGTWRFECVPGGERQRERAFRFGVNVVMYATCLDYKEDQVHIPFIMKKSRR